MQKAPVFRPGPSSVDVVDPYSNQSTPVTTGVVEAIGVYASLTYPHQSLKTLCRLRDAAMASRRDDITDNKPPHQVRRRLGAQATRQIIAAYKDGATARFIATEYKISQTALLGLLRDAGVQLRRQPLTEQQVKRAVRLYESGLSTYAIARETGIPKSTVGRALNQVGIHMRPRGSSKLKPPR